MTTTTESITDLDQQAVETLRFLSADQVQAANSGHPGLPLGASPMAWALWSRHLRHDPSDPHWADRDRFVLSAGHGSALIYSLLHVFGYDVTTEDLANFRQLGSRTPGHPEFGHTEGVETTTGPLGQGVANAVGFAIAEKIQAERFGDVVNHRTFAIVGDGCLMEGISHEAASVAGKLGLGKLVVLWDDNNITIDGTATSSCADDQIARFAAYGWHTDRVEDGTDVDAIDAAIGRALAADDKPSFIAVRTVIGAGAPGIEGTPKAHGSPLGAEVIAGMKAAAGWPETPFYVPAAVQAEAERLAGVGATARAEWHQRVDALDADLAAEWERTQAGKLPENLDEVLAGVEVGVKRATRVSSQAVLKAVSAVMPELVGGSADLAGSTGTDTGQAFLAEGGPRIAFGIREHAMASIMNGISLHGGLRTYGSTFLVFADYLRPALRLSALMKQPVVYILTHDSIGVGEDGPTHQPIEHVESLRIIPGVQVLRPADDVETVAAWKLALERTDGPTALILSRQNTAPLADATPVGGGAQLVFASEGTASVDLLASGSEVEITIAAAQALDAEGIEVRVYSVPSREQFAAVWTDRAPLSASVEAGVTSGWTGLVDLAIGIDEFGASGPGPEVMAHFGFTADNVANRVRELVAGR